MTVGPGFAILCTPAVGNPAHREGVCARLRVTGHEVVEISFEQMQQFAGNVLALRTAAGALIALSTTAWAAFTEPQRRVLERHGTVLALDIPAIEQVGGGGVRCMLAEIHLPKRPG